MLRELCKVRNDWTEDMLSCKNLSLLSFAKYIMIGKENGNTYLLMEEEYYETFAGNRRSID